MNLEQQARIDTITSQIARSVQDALWAVPGALSCDEVQATIVGAILGPLKALHGATEPPLGLIMPTSTPGEFRLDAEKLSDYLERFPWHDVPVDRELRAAYMLRLLRPDLAENVESVCFDTYGGFDLRYKAPRHTFIVALSDGKTVQVQKSP